MHCLGTNVSLFSTWQYNAWIIKEPVLAFRVHLNPNGMFYHSQHHSGCAGAQDPTKKRRAEARFNKDLAKIDNISSHHSKAF